MSFGWSAGDIAAALTLLCNVIQALDTADGTASKYREAVGFLQDLKRTLEPLQRIANLDADSTYGPEIAEQVKHIRGTIEDFLKSSIEYEPALGKKAASGHHRHVWKKLKWFVWQEKKAAALKSKIEGHMRIIDTLVQQLILDATLSIREKLPEQLRTIFTEVLPKELLNCLRTTLLPLQEDVITNRQVEQEVRDSIIDKFEAQAAWLSTDIETIKEDLKTCTAMQRGIKLSLRQNNNRIDGRLLKDHRTRLRELAIISTNVHQKSQGLPSMDGFTSMASSVPSDADSRAGSARDDLAIVKKALKNTCNQALRELHYLVLTYTTYILQMFIKLMIRMTPVRRAIMPVLLARYNISFYDAVGSPPHILPYEFFRNFEVCQSFIKARFRDSPGSELVQRGDFALITTSYNRPLVEKTWNQFVAPGATVFMAMLLRKQIYAKMYTITDGTVETCPKLGCKGQWKRPANTFRGKCPVCEKDVFTPGGDDSSEESEDEEDGGLTDSDSDQSTRTVTGHNFNFAPILSRMRDIRRRSNRVAGPIPPPKRYKYVNVPLLFKRIFTVHEVIQQNSRRDTFYGK